MPAALMTVPMPSTAASLDQYIQTVQSFPLLSQEEEHRFATRWKQSGDLDAAKSLVISHLRVVVTISRNYLGYGLPQADLIQEGNIGLMKAVRRFDPERGVRLVSFAIHWIRAEIHEYILKNWRMVKVATTKAQRKLFFNLRSMKKGTHSLKPDEIRDVAQQLGVREEEVVEMETRLGGRDIPLESNADDDEDGFAPIDYLTDTAAEPSACLENNENARTRSRGLERALATLDARSQRIIQCRWLSENGSTTLHELASEYGVSAERIRQIEQKALQKMRALMRPENAAA